MSRQQRVAYVLSLLIVVAIGLLSFGQDIEFPRTVPAYNQAYTEGADAWGSWSLGATSCPDTMGESGCLVTAFASVLSYYGMNVSVSASQSSTGYERIGMDPGILNDWLRANRGFEGCNLVWQNVPEGITLVEYSNPDNTGLNPGSSIEIDLALRQGFPIIAGVHWGFSCRAGSAQTENCHWIVITGKIGGSYTIIDTINRDTTSRYGVLTTLDRGTKGAYIIDRFVVVKGPDGSEVDVVVGPAPAQTTYRVGDRIQLTLSTPRTSVALIPYARVTKPSGEVAYVTLEGTSASSPRYEISRQSLVADPPLLSSAWTWFNRTATEADIGRWTWEIWVERADDPGTKLGRQTISYNVEQTSASIGAALVGILLVVAIAAVAFLTTLGEGLE